MKSAIIIGATSGIGFELAKIFLKNDYQVGLCGRRIELLGGLKKDHKDRVMTRKVDITAVKQSIKTVNDLINAMGRVDIFIISSGTGCINHDLDLTIELDTVAVNVQGFMAMANIAMKHFEAQGKGHLAAISSIAAIRGGYESPSYNASKSFMSNYLQGLRQRAYKKNIPVALTDIQPGFVDTAMAKGEGLFWVAPPEKAALQIFQALIKRKKHVYVSRRWRLVAWILKIIPDFLYQRL